MRFYISLNSYISEKRKPAPFFEGAVSLKLQRHLTESKFESIFCLSCIVLKSTRCSDLILSISNFWPLSRLLYFKNFFFWRDLLFYGYWTFRHSDALFFRLFSLIAAELPRPERKGSWRRKERQKKSLFSSRSCLQHASKVRLILDQ
jgi:hypothetical protein